MVDRGVSAQPLERETSSDALATKAASPAPAAQTIHPLLARRSPRSILPRPVEPEKLERVFEAARWAPSSFNEQPWRFVLVTNRDEAAVEALRSCLVSGNEWARPAPVLVLTACRTRFTSNGEPNPHAWHDLGMATQNLVLQAVEEGLAARAMAGFDRERAREVLGIPEGFDAVALLALGYPGPITDLPERRQAAERAPRQRRPLHELVFHGRFGRPAELGGASSGR